MAHQPVGTGSSIVVSVGAGHARTSGVISHMSDTLRVAIVGDSEIQGAHVAISKSEFSPAADATNYLVLKDKPATITLNRPSSQRVVGITTGSTTYIDFPEGTGSPFGAQEFGVTPDIMTMAKATTNGIVPFGVVACKEEIYDAVVDAAPKGAVELFHGYTYSGIPVSVAAALAVQDIFEKDDIFKRAKELSPYFQEGLFSLKDIDVVDNIRGYGMMGGIDIKMDGRPGKAGLATFKHCYDAGVNFKATGDALIIAPMFICEKKHIDEIIEKLRTGITNYSKSKKN